MTATTPAPTAEEPLDRLERLYDAARRCDSARCTEAADDLLEWSVATHKSLDPIAQLRALIRTPRETAALRACLRVLVEREAPSGGATIEWANHLDQLEAEAVRALDTIPEPVRAAILGDELESK